MERSGGNPEKALRLAGVRQHADEPKRLFSFKINAKETTMNALYPSMMCVRPADVKRICTVFEKTGIAGLHIDIMDGSFVPNFTLGVDYCRYLHEITSLPLDLHLMIDRPEEKLSWFPIRPGDTVSVHAESTRHLGRAVECIRASGGLPYVALNPATPISAVEDILPALAGVLVMTVNPGFAGQKLIPYTLPKIRRLRDRMEACGLENCPIEVDGNVSAENLVRMKEAGADRFVIGTSGFLNNQPEEELRRDIAAFGAL